MKNHIENFPQYVQEWYEIGQGIHSESIKEFENILLVWMWWSWMALTIMKECIEQSESSYPCRVIKEYRIPKWVNDKTLMIVASYSWNTEETVAAMEQWLHQWAQMIAISSWWVLSQFAQDYNHTLITIPQWIEPRAALPYSLGAQIALFEQLSILKNWKQQLKHFAQWVANNDQEINEIAQTLASKIHMLIPIIYSSQQYEATSLRARQQINENSRMLCWDHQLPEHNHNELLWRQEWDDRCCVIRIEDGSEDARILKRTQLTKKVLSDRNVPQYSLHMYGETFLEKTLSAIYIIDRISYYTAMERGVDPSGMELIERLKWEMKQTN